MWEKIFFLWENIIANRLEIEQQKNEKTNSTTIDPFIYVMYNIKNCYYKYSRFNGV